MNYRPDSLDPHMHHETFLPEVRARTPAETSARASTFAPASSLSSRPIPAREWLVPGLIPSRNVTMLGGDGGTGKSLLALQLAVAAALGRPWLDRTVTQGQALVFSAEDDMDELHRRLAEIVRAESAKLADLNRLTIRSLAGEDALLATLSRATGVMETTPLYHELDERMRDEQPVLVVLDTLADLHSGDENVRAHARQIVGIMRGLAIHHGCAVVVLAHPSLSGMGSGSGLSGSTAWNGSVRSRLYLERITQAGDEPDPDARRLSIKKSNYGRTSGEIIMRWQDGVFVANAVENGLDRTAANVKAERVFLKLLRAFTAQERYVSVQPGPTFAPAFFSKHPDAEGCSKQALRAAMERLFTANKIRTAHHGTGAKLRSHIAEVQVDAR